MSARLTEEEAKALHEEYMKDPEYAAKWNALTGALFGFLADLPEDALPNTPALRTKGEA